MTKALKACGCSVEADCLAHVSAGDPSSVQGELSAVGGGGRRPRRLAKLAFRTGIRPLWRGWSVRRGRHSYTLFHGTNYDLRGWDGPAVVTFHDLSTHRFPQYHPEARVRVINQAMETAVAKGAHVITPSAKVRSEVLDHFGLPAERVTAVPLGVGEAFSRPSEAALEVVLSRYDLLPNGYILAAGSFEPRKNFGSVLSAYQALSYSVRERYPLVHVGPSGWLNDDLAAVASRLEELGQFRRLGFVEENELPALYAGARGLAFPSHYEGFGLPALEAMACGTPVIGSRGTAVEEVIGEAGLLVDPNDVGDLVSALSRLIEDDELVSHLRDVGSERSREFTWEACALQTAEVYRFALSDQGGFWYGCASLCGQAGGRDGYCE
ncbi:glycosyltransferase family 4 protein [Salinisphaera orenii]|uniref:glycosyltransferase family 4 protein n=1 Tax=Salinisphaera orenii TaxID=856731 RepID=UPI00296ECA6D